ncbi:MAG: hypothetical protein PHX83_15785 [Acidobacteriia bacterium]|nr:hypothetical protein [Terriglobia bacterium]
MTATVQIDRRRESTLWLKLVIVGGLVFLTANTITAQAQSSSPENEAAARRIVDSALAAMGGRETLSRVRSLSMLGMTRLQVEGQQVQGAARYVVLRPDRYRADVTIDNKKIIQAFNGKTGWGMEGLKTYPPEIDKRIEMAMQTALYRGLLALFSASSPHLQVRLVGRLDVNDQKADAVDWDDGAGNMTRFYFDIKSHLPLRAVYSDIDSQGNPVVTTDDFFGFRKVDGLVWPYRMIEYQGDEKKREDIFTEIQVNGKVAESYFDPIP